MTRSTRIAALISFLASAALGLASSARTQEATGPEIPGVASSSEMASTGVDLLVQAVANNTSQCTANEFLVRTYRFGVSPISPTLSNQVAFYLLVP